MLFGFAMGVVCERWFVVFAVGVVRMRCCLVCVGVYGGDDASLFGGCCCLCCDVMVVSLCGGVSCGLLHVVVVLV